MQFLKSCVIFLYLEIDILICMPFLCFCFLFFFATAEFDSKDLVQDLNRLLQFSPGSQPNASVLRELHSSFFCFLKISCYQLFQTVAVSGSVVRA